MTPSEFLREKREAMPDWLAQFTNGMAFPRAAFFGSRVVYYPGSGTDGHPVKLFGSAHAAHCFVYVDYGRTQAELEEALQHPEHGFLGHHRLARVHLRESDLVPNGWRSHVAPGEINTAAPRHFASVAAAPFGFWKCWKETRISVKNMAQSGLPFRFWAPTASPATTHCSARALNNGPRLR